MVFHTLDEINYNPYTQKQTAVNFIGWGTGGKILAMFCQEYPSLLFQVGEQCFDLIFLSGEKAV